MKIKILIWVTLRLSLLFMLFGPFTAVHAASTNLIANASLETISAGLPASWRQGKWGTNTTQFSVVTNDGADGSISVKVQTTSYTSGDAKWYFASVPVTAGTTYTFSDYYKSNVATGLIAALDNGAGATTYIEIGSAAASSVWKQQIATLTIPAGIKNMTVYHLLAAVGFLQTDNYVISTSSTPISCPTGKVGTPPNCTTPTVTTTSIVNPSAETVSGSLPLGWQKSAWGTNSAKFTYLTTGAHSGTHALQLKMSRYTDGDAKWTFDSIPVSSTKQFIFSDYYTSTVDSKLYADFDMGGGVESFTYLGTASPSASWAQYATTFSVPIGAKNITVFHLLEQVGTLTTDDYSLAPFVPVGFTRPILSLTFDDGYASYFQNGLPILQKYGFVSTDFIISGVLGQSGYMTTAQVQSLYAAGHEIGSHTVSHPDLTSLTTAGLTNELSASQTRLQQLLNIPVTSLAAPYGAINNKVTTSSKTYYKTIRGVEPGYNAKNNLNLYDLKVQNVGSSTTAADVAGWVTQAQATNTWLVLVLHAVGPNLAAAGQYNATPSQLDSLLATIKASGISVQTLQHALTEITPQL